MIARRLRLMFFSYSLRLRLLLRKPLRLRLTLRTQLSQPQTMSKHLRRRVRETKRLGRRGRGFCVVRWGMRHGGAACDYLVNGARTLEESLFRGRWASVKSTRTHIQTGPALMTAAAAGVPRWQREVGNQLARAVEFLLDIPDTI